MTRVYFFPLSLGRLLRTTSTGATNNLFLRLASRASGQPRGIPRRPGGMTGPRAPGPTRWATARHTPCDHGRDRRGRPQPLRGGPAPPSASPCASNRIKPLDYGFVAEGFRRRESCDPSLPLLTSRCQQPRRAALPRPQAPVQSLLDYLCLRPRTCTRRRATPSESRNGTFLGQSLSTVTVQVSETGDHAP